MVWGAMVVVVVMRRDDTARGGAGVHSGERSTMTELLERALREVSALPEVEQERIAAWILEELASERRWDESFARSADALELLADEALAERRKGKTQALDPGSR